MPIYALQATKFLSFFHPKIKTRNVENVQSAQQRRNDIIDEFSGNFSF